MSGDLSDLRLEVPVWCPGCKRWKRRKSPHIDGCEVALKEELRMARMTDTRPVPFAALLLLYGVLACVILFAIVAWRAVI